MHRSVVRSARDPKSQDRRVKFKDTIKIEEEYNSYEFSMELHPSLKEKEKEVPKEQSKETPKPKLFFDAEEVIKPGGGVNLNLLDIMVL